MTLRKSMAVWKETISATLPKPPMIESPSVITPRASYGGPGYFTHTKPGRGSNGEDRQERDGLFASLECHIQHQKGRLPVGFGPTDKTGYEPAEDSRLVPRPILFLGAVPGFSSHPGSDAAWGSPMLSDDERGQSWGARDMRLRSFPITEQIAKTVPGCSQGDSDAEGPARPVNKPLMRTPRAPCFERLPDRVSAGDTFHAGQAKGAPCDPCIDTTTEIHTLTGARFL